ncbi:MAG: sulfotransferase, partial [Ghiorsea sp.]|nr:sulfotransferase [Ghiorsea sp.]
PWWGGYQGSEKWLWGTLTVEEQRLWQEKSYAYPVLAALAWKKLMQSFVDAEANMDASRYMTCRYEDFLDDPEKTLKHITRWGGLPDADYINEDFLASRVNSNRRESYKQDLSPLQVTDMEFCIGDLLERYGYE